MSILVNTFIALVTLACVLVGALYLYMKKQFRYWGKKKIPHAEPKFPIGSFGEVGTVKNMAQVFRELYEKGAGEQIYGIWAMHRPNLLVRDPELIKNMLVRDFMHFHDHGIYYNEDKDPLSAHLFSLEGVKWRNLRAKLTPTFTSGKMKMMYPIITECAQELQQVLGEIADGEGVFEVKDMLARFGTDVIASCAFGIQTNSLREPNSMFREMGKKIFEPTWSVTFKNMLSFMMPDVAALIKLEVTPKDTAQFFLGVFKETMDYREQNNVRRNDFMQLLIQLKSKGFLDDVDEQNKVLSDKDKFSFEQAAAQAFIFFVGGFETSSSTVQFLLYELALNPELQEKARREIKQKLAENNGQMSYESLHSMDYLSRSVEETLRKYPPAPVLGRVCTKDYYIPEMKFTIEKGTSVWIPTYGLQMDPQHFPNPEKFDPDRFEEHEKATRHNYSYLPFGEGPRHCIGKRFAEMQILAGLTAILSKFKVEVCSQTPIPLELDPKAFLFLPKTGMHLKLSRL